MASKSGRRRCRPLPREIKKVVHAPPESNAGAGWQARGETKSAPNLDLDDYDFVQRQHERGER